MFIFVSRFLAVPPQPPVIVGLEREEVKAGRILVLECVSYGGSPLATLLWTKVIFLHHLLRRLSDTLSQRRNELFCFKNFVASVLQSLHHMGPCGYSNMWLMLPFSISHVHHLCVRMGRCCPWSGRKTLWRRSPSVSSTWRSPLQTIRQCCPVRASTWCPYHLCLWAAKSLCSVSESNS